MAESKYTEQKVNIIAVSKKYKVKPFYCTPVWSNKKNCYLTGQEDLTEEELEKYPLIINPEEHYKIRNNEILTLLIDNKGNYKINLDYVKYKLYLNIPEIAKSRQEVVEGQHLFYMNNIEEDAKNELTIEKAKAKAYAYIENVVSLKDMVDMLYYYGENGNNYSINRAQRYLYRKCSESPYEIISFFENKDINNKIIFIKKLLANKLINRSSTSNYIMYGDVVLGADEKEAAVFLYHEKNNSLFVPLVDQLNKIEGIIK